jgi:hypothetical protein
MQHLSFGSHEGERKIMGLFIGSGQGKPMGDVMALSGHKTVAVVAGYYQADNCKNGLPPFLRI